MHCPSQKNRRGFTLLELLTVIAIIALLSALLMPAAQSLFVEVYAAQTSSRLRDIHTAALMYAQDHGDKYPPSVAYGKSWHFNADFQKCLGYVPHPNELSYKIYGKVLPTCRDRLIDSDKDSDGNNWSFGANYHAFGYQSGNNLGIQDVDTPSKTFMYAEGCDWQLGYQGRKNYRADRDTYTPNTIAYRYKGKALAVAFAGNVFSFDEEEADERSIWYPFFDDQIR